MNVVWNLSEVGYYWTSEADSTGVPGEGPWSISQPIWAFVEGEATRKGSELVLLLYPSLYMEYANGYTTVAKGTEVSLDYLRNSADFVAYGDFDEDDGFMDGQCFSGKVSVKEGESLYLAIITQDYNYRFMYGWVELAIDGEGRLYSPSSAFNYDGDGSLIVGVTPTPEPTSGLLLLVGGALLALRRKQK